MVCRSLIGLDRLAGHRGFRFIDQSEKIAFPGLSSLDLSLPCRVLLHRCRHRRGEPRMRLPPLRFSSPSASSRSRVATCTGRYQLPATCPLSVSHALRALLHPGPAGLVSCRSRPWGFCPSGYHRSQSRAPSRMPLPSWGLRFGVTPTSTTIAASGIGVPLATRAVFRGGSAFSDPLLFRALLPASVHFSG